MKLSKEDREKILSTGYKLVPEKFYETELIVLNSRFIASCNAVFSVEDAREFHSSMRKKYPDASHHVPAYQIGHDKTTLSFSSDDGEPSGSAGKPVLSVLQGSGLGDAVIVVTRYFGGTKLGIGGLVHAYADAAKQLIDELSYAAKIAVADFELVTTYEFYERIRQILSSQKANLSDTNFQEWVTIKGLIPAECLEDCSQKISESTFGKVALKTVGAVRQAVFSLNELLP